MSDRIWNDERRNELRETLHRAVLGELRLFRYSREAIIENCQAVYLEDECPADDLEYYLQFLANEIDQLTKTITSEMSAWPAETDCDRLDRVEKELREKGILL